MPTSHTQSSMSTDSQTMQCMEVWGGNQVVDKSVSMAGLDAWVYCRPHGQSEDGGDVYYVSSCATGRITRLLVADVSGHGAAVCDVAGQLRGLMRKFVNYLDQTRFVSSMNAQFAANTKAGCFATAVVTTFFGPTNHLSLCNAGHPPPLLYRAATGTWGYLKGQSAPPTEAAEEDDDNLTNIPLGIDDLIRYDQFEVDLKVGDLVLCYTDSLIESKGVDGDLLGQEGLIEIVRKLDPSDPATLIPRLLAAVAEQAEGNLHGDDVTVLLFRPNGTAPGTPLRERLLAPLRILRAAAGSLRRGGEPAPWPELSLANVGGAMFSPFNRLWHGMKRGRRGTQG
jgi:sigma-B regulation protein RsbU (phosphoserine phosphatase)